MTILTLSNPVIEVGGSVGMHCGFTEVPVNAITMQVQLAIRPDFQFCVAPIFEILNSSTVYGLNQAARYYGRARARLPEGAHEAWSPLAGMRTPPGTPRNTAPAAVMIDRARIVVPETIVSLISDQETVGFAPKNMLRDSPAPHRQPGLDVGAAFPRWGFDFETAGGPTDTIALLQTNMAEVATATLYAGDTFAEARTNEAEVWTGPFRASQNLPGRPGYHMLACLDVPLSKKFWRLVIFGDAPGDPAPVGEFGHLICGLSRRSKNHAIEKKETVVDLGSLERQRSGVVDRLAGFRMRRVDFDLAMLSESEYETLYADLYWRVGTTDPVLVVPNAKVGDMLHDRILYGPIVGGSITNPTTPRYNRGFSIDSII